MSAHCIAETDEWLTKMLSNFEGRKNLAGVYGRQLPMGFTNPVDKRDLIIVFGLDKRVQEKDYFFHNANSMIPRSIWDKYPFDEKVTNIEDRLWGKQVIGDGYNIIYEPQAAVYHHHGLHQGNSRERVQGVVSILEEVDAKNFGQLPKSMCPESLNVAGVIPIIGDILEDTDQYYYFEKTVNQLKKSQFIKSIYCVCENESIANSFEINWINRKSIKEADSLSLDELLRQVLGNIENLGDFIDSMLYVNHDYKNRPEGIFDELIEDAQYKGCDTVFTGLVDYGHYWHHDGNEYQQSDSSFKARNERDPIYKALYGLGCLTSAWVIRDGDIAGGKIGILSIEDSKYAIRLKN